MDGDLQDPPEVLPQFVGEVARGLRRRLRRPPASQGRACSSGWATSAFYRILNAISDLDIPLDSGDFCLMDRRVVDVLKHLPERMRFVRGLRTFVGFRQVGLAYERAARAAGQPKYTFRGWSGWPSTGWSASAATRCAW